MVLFLSEKIKFIVAIIVFFFSLVFCFSVFSGSFGNLSKVLEEKAETEAETEEETEAETEEESALLPDSEKKPEEWLFSYNGSEAIVEELNSNFRYKGVSGTVPVPLVGGTEDPFIEVWEEDTFHKVIVTEVFSPGDTLVIEAPVNFFVSLYRDVDSRIYLYQCINKESGVYQIEYPSFAGNDKLTVEIGYFNFPKEFKIFNHYGETFIEPLNVVKSDWRFVLHDFDLPALNFYDESYKDFVECTRIDIAVVGTELPSVIWVKAPKSFRLACYGEDRPNMWLYGCDQYPAGVHLIDTSEFKGFVSIFYIEE